MKIVFFLDFDGVLHPQPCVEADAFCRLHLVEEVLREFQNDIEIVVSSSWRDHHTLNELQEMFAQDIRHLVVGVTPSIANPSPGWRYGDGPSPHEREFEIETWLQTHRSLETPWIAIDDRPDWFRQGSPDLLVTDRRTGFEEAQQRALRLMLKLRKDEL